MPRQKNIKVNKTLYKCKLHQDEHNETKQNYMETSVERLRITKKSYFPLFKLVLFSLTDIPI